MDTGVAIFPTHDAIAPADLAQLAEERGHESLFFTDHTHIPASRQTPYPGGELPRRYAHTFDLFVAVTAAVTATTRLRVGSGVCLVIERDPIITAKQVASVDFLSGGRFEFGVGAGWIREEMANHGTDPRLRMAVMRERVEAMKAIWTSDEASYKGQYVSFDRIWSWPKPAQRPHPPVLVGGNGPGVLDRVLSFGDAWFPSHAPDGILERARELRARATRPIALMVMGVPADARVLEAYAAAGFQRAVHELPSAPRGPVERALDRYEAAVAELNGESRPLGPREPGNDAAGNEVIGFSRTGDGALAPQGRYSTGGRGTGLPHLASAGSVVLSDDGRWLLVVNAGSDELSLFAVQPDGLRLADHAGSGGSKPTSVAVSGALVYVLNNGTPNISGFGLADGKLAAIPDSTRSLSSADADPAQVSFTTDGTVLIVTERGTDTISSYLIDERGHAQGPATVKSSGQTPYGFGLTADRSLIVSEAFGGATGEAAASSYAVSSAGELTMVSGSVGDTRSEVCWVALTKDDRFAYVTNFGDGTVSSYEITADRSLKLRDPVAASAGQGQKGIRDEAISGDGRYLYAIHADAQKVCGWAVGQAGQLTPAGEFGGVPGTVAGLAAS